MLRRGLRLACATSVAMATVALVPQLATVAHAAVGDITTYAGTGVNGYSGDGGAATNAQVRFPYGFATDAAGNVYFSDETLIRRVDPAGTITTFAGQSTNGFGGDGGPATSAYLSTPSSLAFDGAGNLYVSDNNNGRIRRITPAGIISTVAGGGTGSGNGVSATSVELAPRCVASDSAGTLYVCDVLTHSIRKVSGGIITTVAGTGTAGYSGDGGAATSAQLNIPSAALLDGAGNLIVADRNNHRIRKIATNGVITTIAGTGTAGTAGDGGPATSAQLYFPDDLARNSAGELFVAEASTHRIRKIATNVITRFAGTGTAGYSGDGGPATNAQLNQPYAVGVDASGNVLIGDSLNRRIRRVAATNSSTPVPATVTVSPGSQTKTTGQTATLTAHVTDASGAAIANTTVNFSRSGANPGTGSAVTNASGDATYNYSGGTAGTDTVTATAASSGANGSATVTWQSPPPAQPASVALSPSAQTRTVGQSATLTAHVTDVNGAPVAGAAVTFSRTGANSGNATTTTNASGDATHTYTGANAGADTVTATATSTGVNGQATVTWQPVVLPPTPAPSDSCDSGVNVVSGFVGDAYLKVRHRPSQSDPNALWICVAGERGGVHVGGLVTVDGVAPGQPVIVDQDAPSVLSCGDAVGNVRLQSGTVLGGQPYWLDVAPSPAGSGDIAWVCVRFTSTVGVRLRVSAGGLPGSTGFVPDTGAHAPAYTVPAWPASGPSAACLGAAGSTRYVDLTVGFDRVALYSWAESATRSHVCLRGGAYGGRLTLDTAASPGVSPVLTTRGDISACSFDIVTGTSPSYGVYISDPASLPDPPVSGCVTAGGVALGVTLGANGPATAAWLQD